MCCIRSFSGMASPTGTRHNKKEMCQARLICSFLFDFNHERIKAPLAKWITRWSSEPKIVGSTPTRSVHFFFFLFSFSNSCTALLCLCGAYLGTKCHARFSFTAYYCYFFWCIQFPSPTGHSHTHRWEVQCLPFAERPFSSFSTPVLHTPISGKAPIHTHVAFIHSSCTYSPRFRATTLLSYTISPSYFEFASLCELSFLCVYPRFSCLPKYNMHTLSGTMPHTHAQSPLYYE